MKKRNDQSIKEVLEQLLGSMPGKTNYKEFRVRQIWQEAMSKSINDYTKKIYVSKGKLYLYIDSAPLKQELTYGKEKIVSLINDELGEKYIHDVVFI